MKKFLALKVDSCGISTVIDNCYNLRMAQWAITFSILNDLIKSGEPYPKYKIPFDIIHKFNTHYFNKNYEKAIDLWNEYINSLMDTVLCKYRIEITNN